MAYIDFEFYQNEYNGKSIKEEDFPKLANLAMAYIDANTMGRARRARGDILEAVKTATCVLAEVYQQEQAMGVNIETANLSSQTVGGWTKSFKTPTTADLEMIENKKRNLLTIYLAWTGLLNIDAYYYRGDLM